MNGIIIRTSVAGEPSFTLGVNQMTENDKTPYYLYYLYRSDLRRALKNEAEQVTYHIVYTLDWGDNALEPAVRDIQGWIEQGQSKRGKKFIQIGCKRFVGVNRLKLIRWAKSGK